MFESSKFLLVQIYPKFNKEYNNPHKLIMIYHFYLKEYLLFLMIWTVL